MGYEQDIRLETRFDKVIKSILGNFFIKKDVMSDKYEGTDFAIYSLTPIKVGARLRTFKYFSKYPNEFTIRWARPSKVDTEIHKIRAGLVNHLFYGFVNEKEDKILQYFIGDLSLFRMREPKPLAIYDNQPPDSQLAVYKINQMPKDFVLKFWTEMSNS